jgi:hypothetical protein
MEDIVHEIIGGLVPCEARWLRIPVLESLAFRHEDFGEVIEAPLTMHIVEDFKCKASDIKSDLKVYTSTKKGVKPS